MSKQRTCHVSAGEPARAITARAQRCVAQAFIAGSALRPAHIGDSPDFGRPCSSVSVRREEVLAGPDTPRDKELTVQQHSLLRQERRRQRQLGRLLQSCPRNWDRCLKFVSDKPEDDQLSSAGDNISIQDFALTADLHGTTQTFSDLAEFAEQLLTGTSTTVTSPPTSLSSAKPEYSRPQRSQAPADHLIEEPSEQHPALQPAVSDDSNAHRRTTPKAKSLRRPFSASPGGMSTTAVATWLASTSDQHMPSSSREVTSNQLGSRCRAATAGTVSDLLGPSFPRVAQAPTPRKHKVSGMLPVLFSPSQSGGMLNELVTMTHSVSEAAIS